VIGTDDEGSSEHTDAGVSSASSSPEKEIEGEEQLDDETTVMTGGLSNSKMTAAAEFTEMGTPVSHIR